MVTIKTCPLYKPLVRVAYSIPINIWHLNAMCDLALELMSHVLARDSLFWLLTLPGHFRIDNGTNYTQITTIYKPMGRQMHLCLLSGDLKLSRDKSSKAGVFTHISNAANRQNYKKYLPERQLGVTCHNCSIFAPVVVSADEFVDHSCWRVYGYEGRKHAVLQYHNKRTIMNPLAMKWGSGYLGSHKARLYVVNGLSSMIKWICTCDFCWEQ